jgi:hypothetical protein
MRQVWARTRPALTAWFSLRELNLSQYGNQRPQSVAMGHWRHLAPQKRKPSRYQRGAYSITSSARPINASGTVMPSALAVLRLMISSTFVACWTGRSAG